MTTPALADRSELVTADWLTEVLRFAASIDDRSRVATAVGRPIGTGQVGTSVRFSLGYDGPAGPATVVCKFASYDLDSARAGVASGTYETEVAFYRELAPTVEVNRPHCYFAAVEPGTADMVLVLEDLTPATQGDQLAGATIEEAEQTMSEAAKLHGPRWGDQRLLHLGWLSRDRRKWLWRGLPRMWDDFVVQYHRSVDPVILDQGRRLLGCVDVLSRRRFATGCAWATAATPTGRSPTRTSSPRRPTIRAPPSAEAPTRSSSCTPPARPAFPKAPCIATTLSSGRS